jgi:hypothetical protein
MPKRKKPDPKLKTMPLTEKDKRKKAILMKQKKRGK